MSSVQSGYAPVNGLEMYYEISGSGAPLVVLHGGFMSIDAMGPIIPRLAETRQVIAVELHGHGRTADIDRPMSLEAMGGDIIALLDYLNLPKADVLGFSMGGKVAYHAALQQPERINKLVLISAPAAFEDWYPSVREGMSQVTPELMHDTPMYTEYARLAPRVEDWTRFGNKMREMMTSASAGHDKRAELAALNLPILLIIGDADGMSPARTAEFFAMLGGGLEDGMSGNRPASQLAILPGCNHWTIIDRVDLLLPCIKPFLEDQAIEAAPKEMGA